MFILFIRPRNRTLSVFLRKIFKRNFPRSRIKIFRKFLYQKTLRELLYRLSWTYFRKKFVLKNATGPYLSKAFLFFLNLFHHFVPKWKYNFLFSILKTRFNIINAYPNYSDLNRRPCLSLY